MKRADLVDIVLCTTCVSLLCFYFWDLFTDQPKLAWRSRCCVQGQGSSEAIAYTSAFVFSDHINYALTYISLCRVHDTEKLFLRRLIVRMYHAFILTFAHVGGGGGSDGPPWYFANNLRKTRRIAAKLTVPTR